MNFIEKISDAAVCNWFYVFFIINAIIASIAFLTFFMTLFAKVGGASLRGVLSARVFVYLLTAVVSSVNTLFFYIICQRSLQPEKGQARLQLQA